MLGNLELGGPLAPLAAPPSWPQLVFEIDWTDDPTFPYPSGAWTDYSDLVRAFSTRRGRNNTVARVETGQGSVLLDNRTGEFNPGVANRLLMKRVRLSALYDSQVFPIMAGYIDAYRYGYPGTDTDAVVELVISDGLKVLAQQVFPLSYSRENEPALARLLSCFAAAGIPPALQSVPSSFLDTDDLAPVNATGVSTTQTRSATLTNGSASVTVSSTVGILAGGQISAPGIPNGTSILTIDSGTTLTLSQPAVLSYTSGELTGLPGGNTLSGIDPTKVSVGMSVGAHNNNNGQPIFETGTIVTAVDGTVATINPPIRQVTFWDGFGTPGTITGEVFTAGASQTLTFARRYLQVQAILNHIRQIEDTERGLFVILKDGTFQYQGSGYRAAQSVACTFGENAGEIPYVDVPIVYDDQNVTNEYVITNEFTGSVFVVSDASSQRKYFRHSQAISQLWYADQYSLPASQQQFEPIPRFEGISALPAGASTQPPNPIVNWPKVLALEIGSKVSARRRPMGGSDIFAAYDQFVEGIQVDATPEEWRIRFVTSPSR